jgi:hypothetical protein
VSERERGRQERVRVKEMHVCQSRGAVFSRNIPGTDASKLFFQ